MASNIVTNLPAVLLQRRNRGRVARLLARRPAPASHA
jgi:hypothetical protein